ncbi:hypothetical protein ACHAW5_000543 [Stephanodiscus triporus]|uniref:Uncharacterized protein n=1 Tax=Stephanodiscus triporus TaxID=2934178 RepID=A0ABD3PUE6_9STRA
MGCLQSSTAATSAYPGNRRVAKPVYQPSHDEYKQVDAATAVAQAHFCGLCPGVTLPSGVHAGDVIHVKAWTG